MFPIPIIVFLNLDVNQVLKLAFQGFCVFHSQIALPVTYQNGSPDLMLNHMFCHSIKLGTPSGEQKAIIMFDLNHFGGKMKYTAHDIFQSIVEVGNIAVMLPLTSTYKSIKDLSTPIRFCHMMGTAPADREKASRLLIDMGTDKL